MSKTSKQQLWTGVMLVLIAATLIIVAILNAMKGKETGNVAIDGETKVAGLVCRDTVSIHPAMISVPMRSRENTITASFRDDMLSSISLFYDGFYGTEKGAESAEAFARSDYNEILVKEYGEQIDIFSVNFSVDGTRMQMVQTTRDIGKINVNTVTYFLLDQGTSIANTLEGLKKQYETKGFSCEISD